MPTIYCRRPLMATLFEAWLVGDDQENVSAVADVVLNEIERLEGLLSRFDRSSETYRLNQNAGGRAVQVDRELFSVLRDCIRWQKQTDGSFSVVCPLERQQNGATFEACVNAADPIELDHRNSTVRLVDRRSMIDFGGYAKGYALDSICQILDRFGVESAVVHGGTSSIIVRGRSEDRSAWRIGLQDPFPSNQTANDQESPLLTLALTDCGISTSMAYSPFADSEESWNESNGAKQTRMSDVVDPRTAIPMTEQAACTVITETARDAEVLSTACLVMGPDKSVEYLHRRRTVLPERCCVAWYGQRSNRTMIEWLFGDPHEFEPRVG